MKPSLKLNHLHIPSFSFAVYEEVLANVEQRPQVLLVALDTDGLPSISVHFAAELAIECDNLLF